MKLEGRVTLVSGGSRGIGKGIALAHAAAGANVAINYHSDDQAAEQTLEAIRALGREALAFKVDVTDYAQVQDMVGAIISSFGKLDIVINNAGIASSGLFVAETEADEFQRLFSLHVMGAIHCTKAALPHLRNAGRGDIHFISSMSALHCPPGHSSYASAKAALEAFAKCLAKEEARHNIRVNVIACGAVETDMGIRYAKAVKRVKDIAELSTVLTFGRFCQPSDIGNLSTFLASELGSYISGHVIYVDASAKQDGITRW